jgi:hypothetical protein
MMAIVKANYLPQAQSGRIGRSVAYCTWREGADQQPRSWHDQDGRELHYDTAKDEVAEHAWEASYTYRIVLSTRDAALDPEHYAAVLNEHFDDFYLTTHHAGEHPHSHAIAFSDHRLSAGELGEMREHLHELEIEREQQLELDPMSERSL